jgi:hypothetical protein
MKDTDRELLEMAAKAAGIEIIRSRLKDPMFNDMLLSERHQAFPGLATGWNPLEDDGDAFRLAFNLGMQVHMDDFGSIKAVRRDIVRAAAEIGRAMK